MPVSDAWAFLGEKQNDPKLSSIPVVGLSASMEAESLALEAGVEVFMPKPFEFKHLIWRSEEHTSELQSHSDLVCRLLLAKKKKNVILQLPVPCRNASLDTY